MFSSNSPDITLVFNGLFLFAFDEEKGFCQLGIMEAEKHCLKIRINIHAASLPDSPELLFEVPDGDIFFEVSRSARGVDTYEPGTFDRDAAHDRRDFRWVLDFEGRELHNRQLRLKAGALQRSIFINNGLFYTHDTQEVIIKRPSSASPQAAGMVGSENFLPLTNSRLIAASVGCDVYLGDREELLFRYGPSADYSISLKKDRGISYEILVENLCSQEENPVPPGSSDFTFYYKVLDVPENERFKVLPLGTADDINPCNSARLSITKAPLG
jgi:hypothetical protein